MFAFLVDHPSHLWLYIGCFGLSFSSAVLPWLSAELVVVALPAVARSPVDLAGLVLIATTGQMTGKCFVYAVGRFSIRLRSARMRNALERWEERIARSRFGPGGLVFLSSLVGVPSFFAIAAVAGSMRMDLRRFLAAGTAGRVIRFGLLAWVPWMISHGASK